MLANRSVGALRAVVIAGPTASGKSALALAVAERDGGWVINADALQVYDCWRILTARPDADACARAPHRLYGHVACSAPYSVGAWLHDVEPQIDAARDAGVRPVIVGGTGLYLTALTVGLAAIPPVPAQVRTRSEAALRTRGLDGLCADLARDDPATLAQIDRANPMRVQRAWEVLAATGRGLSAWRATGAVPVLPKDAAELILMIPEKDSMNKSISSRFHRMLEEGALDEVARYRSIGDQTRQAVRALGATDLIAYLDGRTTLGAATDAAIAATRRYAKRQRTWFRARMTGWRPIDPGADDPLAAVHRS